ncbi:MAG: bifunctional folylpolyglutamate synthase/dihydrofolate synthase [Paludibacteraceae bacterium]|nr:bifunctional folylpolyglutamate synthase/dihydrofolate synthase [Paludibacteraceae bacterium]
MTYDEAISYLYASTPAFHLIGKDAYKPGLENTIALMEHLGKPYTQWPSVHIAGTNGKGSTSHLIAASLQCAGLKVGLYTSPHLVDFRERIRVLNRNRMGVEATMSKSSMIPKEKVIQFVEDNRSFLDRLRPSFFETAMAMAFWYFAEQKVDIAVIEVGLGGRLDSTNIITPLLSVITNIGFDHTEFLGDTLAKIAGEKAGIIKSDVPCVIGETNPETAPVFMAKAQECNILGNGLETTTCKLWFADQCNYLRRCRERDIPVCELHGLYQDKNMQTAYVALRALSNILRERGISLTTDHYKRGFAQVCTLTGLRGRWETLCNKPLTICDTGHNSHGIKYVAQQLQQLSTTHNILHIVIGMVDDKDVEEVMKVLPTQARYYFTQAKTHRAIPASKMLALHNSISPVHNAQDNAYSSVKEAILAAQKEATDQDIIFIGGSNYVVGEALTLFDYPLHE